MSLSRFERDALIARRKEGFNWNQENLAAAVQEELNSEFGTGAPRVFDSTMARWEIGRDDARPKWQRRFLPAWLRALRWTEADLRAAARANAAAALEEVVEFLKTPE